jgi:hypothetical protein
MSLSPVIISVRGGTSFHLQNYLAELFAIAQSAKVKEQVWKGKQAFV